MKRITPIVLLLFLLSNVSHAQNQVRDVFPNASISVIDYQSGQQVPVNTDDAILFKDAFINLVINTQSARMHNTRMIPGRKTVRVIQADPQANGNAFQLDMETTSFGRSQIVYSFLYNVDQNTLYYFNPSSRNWVPEVVRGNNVINMNNCLAYGKFNQGNGQPEENVQGNQGDDGSEYDSAVDTDVSAETAPPPLPEYEQPECPTEGYLWQPGYWAFSPIRGGYYWVPGVWVAPPTVGYLWTPPYWGFVGGRYMFHVGYWGPHIGFYGGINYGFGYGGVGFVGGEWYGGRFRYNTAVVRVNTVVVHNTYVNRTVINNTTVVNNRVSFNGQGGVTARPSQAELSANNDHHVMATAEQNRNQQLARSNNAQFASNNRGAAPSNLAAQRPPDRSAFNNLPRNSGQRNNTNNNQGVNGAQRANNPNQRNGSFGNQGQRPNNNTNPGGNQNLQGTPGQRPNGNTTPGNNPNAEGTQNQRPNGQTPANGNNPNAQQGNRQQRQQNNMNRQQRGQRNNNRQPKQQHEEKEKKN
ncbi:MAG TPA: YXWGXW repeat-containing protein [Mucilaginibacter sp.]|nr:YXWGXW repeat-containing protein [Mucilaginibacter sp.]